MLLNNDIIFEIVRNNKRFSDPYDDNSGYYIFNNMNHLNGEFDIELVELYYEKLRYAVSHADALIKGVFDDSFYNFYGVNKAFVNSPAQMCSELCFDSFVMFTENRSIGSCLSNSRFMFGHFIEVTWDSDWNIKNVWIN